MNNLLDYIETEELVTTGYYSLYSVEEKASKEKFILKKFLRIDEHQLATLKSGVQLALELKLDSILEPIHVFEEGIDVGILYKPFDGVSLRTFFNKKNKFAAKEFVKVSKNIASLVTGFHDRGWVIKNCCPENILIHPETYECKLGDLRKATRIFKNENVESLDHADLLELQYISPEQTGRINQITDHRSDFYSLGIIFYEMLTGRLPFNVSNRAEIIHAHLSLPVEIPIKIDQTIPNVLNDIVLKLLSKGSVERYQSSEGLLYDLDIAEGFLDSPNTFKAGQKDKIHKIVPTSKLVGRKEELETIENVYKIVKSGKKQAVYISGYSGVGKTRLIQEFYKNKLTDNIPMVASKFDILQRAAPYSALLEAITEIVNKLLKEDDDQLEYWKKRLQSYLKENACLIINVIPELEALIGSQEEVNNLPPDETQMRFQQTFINFIAAFTTDENNLILFLDDLQWADFASIRLIEMLLLDDSINNLLFIGAYRDNEVDGAHPLDISLRKQEQWININEVKISAFNEEDTRELILQTLHDPVQKGGELAQILYRKSGGNTFYTLQLLTSLFEENLLFRNEEGVWNWNEKLINQESVTANLVEFLVKKIENLEIRLQSLLKIAACIGDMFDLKVLALLADEKMNHVADELAVAVNMGYLVSMDENVDAFFKMISSIHEDEFALFNNTRFRFSHDRIRQAALVLVNTNELAKLNLKTARIKLQYLSETQKEEELFYLANHLNAGEKLIKNEVELQHLITYNYRAGIKAKNTSAYDSAIDYFSSAEKHLNFDDNYTPLYDIYLKRSQCRYLSGDYQKAEKELDVLYNSCTNRLDKLNTLFTKVYLYNIQDKKYEAMEAGRMGYSLYNIKMPVKSNAIMLLLLKDLMFAKIKLPEKKISNLINMPLMEDQEKIRFQEFLLAMSPTIYQYNQKLFAWNFMRMVFGSLKYGNSGVSSIAFIGYGMLVSQLFGKYKIGEKLADVAIEINSKLGYTALKWKVRLSYYNFVHHWTRPIRGSLDKILEVENGAFANGDPIFAGYAIFIYHQQKFALGFHLDKLHDSFETYLKVVKKRRDAETEHFLKSYYYAIRCLIGYELDTQLMGANYDAPLMIKESTALLNYSVVADIYIAYMGILYMFGHYEKAWNYYLQSAKYVSFVEQRYEFAEFNLYGVLICSAVNDLEMPTKKNPRKLAKKHLAKLKTWKKLCPENFEPQYLIASAVYTSMSKNNSSVNALFEKAIACSEKYRFINYKALAGELAGRRQHKVGNRIMSQTYLNNARSDYQRWGAIAKVKQLESSFEDIFSTSIIKQKSQTTDESLVAGMDLNLVLQANQAVKSAKDVDSLIVQLMNVIIKYSNADNGYLLVKNKSELIITAGYTIASGAESLTEYPDNEILPLSIIKYVIRLKKLLILNNPSQIAEYSNNRYFKNNHPKSLICYPILKQGDVFGVLFLENHQHEGVFNEKKISILNLISAQVAVSLDNAFLYENLEKKVLERTEKIQTEKGIVDAMLENILPKASINELKRTGKTTARKFEGVTVLMADIKGFTKISEVLSPEELIAKIDFYFRSFDMIMEKYKLEKIKTIGDAYMAAGGLMGNINESAINMVLAALEMQECMYKENIGVADADKLEMRIGLNTGIVIAGVVGIKKYQYDIWGDTVNIAARMEQQSEPGRINVSLETYSLTNNLVNYTYRGEIEGKNKGLMRMYFVESIK